MCCRIRKELEVEFHMQNKTQCNKGVFRSPYHLSVHVLQGFPSAPEKRESPEWAWALLLYLKHLHQVLVRDRANRTIDQNSWHPGPSGMSHRFCTRSLPTQPLRWIIRFTANYTSWSGVARGKCSMHSPVIHTCCRLPEWCSIYQSFTGQWTNTTAHLSPCKEDNFHPKNELNNLQTESSPDLDRQESTRLSFSLTFSPFGPGKPIGPRAPISPWWEKHNKSNVLDVWLTDHQIWHENPPARIPSLIHQFTGMSKTQRILHCLKT